MSILTDEDIQALPKPTTQKEVLNQLRLVGAEMVERVMDDIWIKHWTPNRYSSSHPNTP